MLKQIKIIKPQNTGHNAFVTSVVIDIGHLSDIYKIPITYQGTNKLLKMRMKTKLIGIVDAKRTDKHIIGADNLLDFFVKFWQKRENWILSNFDNFSNNIRTT